MVFSPLAITLKFGDVLGGFSSEERLAEPDQASMELLREAQTKPHLNKLPDELGAIVQGAVDEGLVSIDGDQRVSLTPLGSYALASMKTTEGTSDAADDGRTLRTSRRATQTG
jgi:hypothetical protein